MPARAGNEAAAGTGRRQRNARGQGSRLTDDIVTAALGLIDRTGTQESVTLRAVAREIGIAAPSIYAHFADRDAIVLAVVARLFDDLAAAIRAATPATPATSADPATLATPGDPATPADPVAELVAGCQAYVRYGLENPARYRLLFSDSRDAEAGGYCTPVAIGSDEGPVVLEFGAEAFAMLADGIERCVRAGASESTDVVADGTAVWTALHGTVTLRTALPGFPWPEPVDGFVRELVLRLARIRTSS